MNMRLSTFMPGRGWAPGLGRFTGDELQWYRLFSFGIRPRRVLVRHQLVIEERRAPAGAERLAMPEGWVVVRCGAGHRVGHPGTRPVGPGPVTGSTNGGASAASVELALAESAYTEFLSWVESAPPGAR